MDDVDAEDADGDEEAPINPSPANKKKRERRYVCAYLRVLARYFAVTIAGVGLVVGLYFLFYGRRMSSMMSLNSLVTVLYLFNSFIGKAKVSIK